MIIKKIMIVCIIKAYLVTREVFGGLFLLPQSLASTMIEWIVNSQSLGFPRLLRFLGPQKTDLVFSDHNVRISSTERDP